MKIFYSLNSDITPLLSPREDTFEVVMEQYFTSISIAQKLYGYDNIVLVCSDVIESFWKTYCKTQTLSNVKSIYLSEPKFQVIQSNDDKFIHLDGDVFLNNCIIFNPSIDALVEHEVDIYNSYYKHGVEKLFPLLKSDIPEFKLNIQAYGCGIVGIFNPELKTIYLQRFKTFKDIMTTIKHTIDDTRLCMIAEQYLLSCIIHYHNFQHEIADKHSFIHLYGRNKFYKKNILHVQEMAKGFKSYKSFIEDLKHYDKTGMVIKQLSYNKWQMGREKQIY
jgi:hypothetical protein